MFTFILCAQPFNLSRAEVLNLINLCPSSPVEVFLVVDNCDQRLTDEQARALVTYTHTTTDRHTHTHTHTHTKHTKLTSRWLTNDGRTLDSA